MMTRTHVIKHIHISLLHTIVHTMLPSCTTLSTGTPLRLCYQRHAYGLGEHYNSVVPGEASDTEEEAEEDVEEHGTQNKDAAEGEASDDEGDEDEDALVDNPYADDEPTGNKTKAAANQAKAMASLRKKKGRDAGGRGNSRAGVFV